MGSGTSSQRGGAVLRGGPGTILSSMPVYPKALLATAAVLMLLSCIGAPYPEQMYLQHIPTVLALAALALLAKRETRSPTPRSPA